MPILSDFFVGKPGEKRPMKDFGANACIRMAIETTTVPTCKR